MTTFADAKAIADKERERCCGIIELCILAGRATEAVGFIRSALDVGSVQLKLAREAAAVRPTADDPPESSRVSPGFDPEAIRRELAKPTIQ
jgi:hypothetical protein